MRRIGLAAAVAVLSSGCDQARSVSSPEGRFTVEMPGRPKLETASAAAAEASSFESTRWGCGYSVAWGDAKPIDANDLHTAIEVMARHYKATILREESVTSHGIAGRAFGLKAAGNLVFEGQVFQHKSRFYILLARCPAARYDWVPTVRSKTKHFFDSFRIQEEPRE